MACIVGPFGLPDSFLWIVGIFVITAALLLLSARKARKRTQAIAGVALEMGFVFIGKDWGSSQSTPEPAMPLFNTGHNRRFANIMTGSSAGFPVSVFDYSYVVGSGRNSSTHSQTVAAFSKAGMSFPVFDLHAEGLLEKIGEAIAHRDIHFDSHPGFSKIYRLRSPDVDKTRRVFTPGLLSSLEGLDERKKWRLEGANDTLIVFRGSKTVKPAELRLFLEETSAVASQFLGLCGKGK